jgi:hypothetical protein
LKLHQCCTRQAHFKTSPQCGTVSRRVRLTSAGIVVRASAALTGSAVATTAIPIPQDVDSVDWLIDIVDGNVTGLSIGIQCSDDPDFATANSFDVQAEDSSNVLTKYAATKTISTDVQFVFKTLKYAKWMRLTIHSTAGDGTGSLCEIRAMMSRV